MKKQFFVALVITWLSYSAHAVLIVDTGPGPGGTVGGPSLFSSQFIAGEFTTTQDWNINSVEGWISLNNIGDTATATIYSDSGGLPGSALFSSAFSSIGDRNAVWDGASGLNWLLSTGTYWLAFEVLAGQTMDAAMPGPPTTPLSRYAVGSSNGYRLFNTDVGMRIDASSPVPAPATLALFGLGLASLGWARRKRV